MRLQAQQHFALRRLPADQPRIAALGHDGEPGVAAETDHGHDLNRGAGGEQDRCSAVILVAPLHEMRRDGVRVRGVAARGERGGEGVECEGVGGHGEGCSGYG